MKSLTFFGLEIDRSKRAARWTLTALVMSFVMFATACSVSTIVDNTVKLLPVLTDILNILVATGTISSSQAASLKGKADTDGKLAQQLYNDYVSAKSSGSPQLAATWTVMNSAFTVFEEDAASVFQLAQVSDKNVQTKVTLIVSSAQAALAIIETLVPASPIVSAPPRRFASSLPAGKVDVKYFVKNYNRVLDLKTGNTAVDKLKLHKIHLHNVVVRYGSLGVLNY